MSTSSGRSGPRRRAPTAQGHPTGPNVSAPLRTASAAGAGPAARRSRPKAPNDAPPTAATLFPGIAAKLHVYGLSASLLCLACIHLSSYYFNRGRDLAAGQPPYDPLSSLGINGPLVSIDLWSFLHVLWFAVCGFLYPGRMGTLMMYGILWEVVEWLMGGLIDQFWRERVVNLLWDLWFNLLGYRLGEYALIAVLERLGRREVIEEGDDAGPATPGHTRAD
ncbi:hypothetical protein H696_04287 [Fonticula alba]|uniref:Uncharacterized protein n=1 Tax=Fonticula alba TaxID=691883 RepID=A0A058Z4L9_FONAL|nr:hypothetical protein H696_04287 [Fonticula alba]KCV68868.1 hypothetical protein H696_04287 [Fonticula alba]|eukprot:XP_009496439.1 hypothetical protein H696_04287 [Fonticula alba]